MNQLFLNTSTKAILHIDGDAFFVSCEMSVNPSLKGKPVVTGHERGIASALSYEAKERGITRGMPVWQIKQICPEVIVIPSDYSLYKIFSNRMLAIVRRFTDHIEAYSIDECFADITEAIELAPGTTYKEKSTYIVSSIQQALQSELGMTFSCGVGPTKVLAKVASKWKKPNGLTIISPDEIQSFLAALPIHNIWGIGPKSSVYLQKKEISTALDFVTKPLSWIDAMIDKPLKEIWHELKGEQMMTLSSSQELQKSLSATRSFTPVSSDRLFVFSQLIKNIEEACSRARADGLVAEEATFFIKTKHFTYEGGKVRLSEATVIPQEIIEAITPLFVSTFKPKMLYRATGVTLYKLRTTDAVQKSFFTDEVKQEAWQDVYKKLDTLNNKFGYGTVHSAASLTALDYAKAGHKREEEIRSTYHLAADTKLRRLMIPYLGEVK